MVNRTLYVDGVFRPEEPVDLPEATEVELDLRPARSDDARRLDAIYDLLEARFDSGDEQVAACHDDHQPNGG